MIQKTCVIGRVAFSNVAMNGIIILKTG